MKIKFNSLEWFEVSKGVTMIISISIMGRFTIMEMGNGTFRVAEVPTYLEMKKFKNKAFKKLDDAKEECQKLYERNLLTTIKEKNDDR